MTLFASSDDSESEVSACIVAVALKSPIDGINLSFEGRNACLSLVSRISIFFPSASKLNSL